MRILILFLPCCTKTTQKKCNYKIIFKLWSNDRRVIQQWALNYPNSDQYVQNSIICGYKDLLLLPLTWSFTCQILFFQDCLHCVKICFQDTYNCAVHNICCFAFSERHKEHFPIFTWVYGLAEQIYCHSSNKLSTTATIQYWKTSS